MGVEPERKFLTRNDTWKQGVTKSFRIVQAYLSKDTGRIVRVRIQGDEAFLTIKGEAPKGTIDTPEFEYPIPSEDAEALLKLCLPGAIIKTRHLVPFAGKTWEVDVFEGDNKGLVMAEIEFKGADRTFAAPDWLGEEVTDDPRFKNAALSEKPYGAWGTGGATNTPRPRP